MNIIHLKKCLLPFLEKTSIAMEPFSPNLVLEKGRRYWHIDNGGDILLVAHIDTVQSPKYRGTISKRVYADGLDDRLGVCLSFEIAKERNDCDVLITDEEEKGSSTAKLLPQKVLSKYRLIIGLDRAGCDFVDYKLSNGNVLNTIGKIRKKGSGSFSDICFLVNPPCSCINMGIGYYEAHSKYSYCDIDEVNKALKDVKLSIDKTKGVDTTAPMPSTWDYWDDGNLWSNEDLWDDCLCFDNFYRSKEDWAYDAKVFASQYGLTCEEIGLTLELINVYFKQKEDPASIVDILCEDLGHEEIR